MSELPSLLCALTAISLVCYGFWAGLFWIIRNVNSVDQSPQIPGHCPECGSRLRRGQNHCSICGERLVMDGPVTLERELRSTARRLRQFAESGKIDTETAEKVDQAISDTFDRLRSTSPRPHQSVPNVQADLPKTEPEPVEAQEPASEFDDLFEEDAAQVERKKPRPKPITDSVMEILEFDSESSVEDEEPLEAEEVETPHSQPAENVEHDKLVAAVQSAEETHSLSAFLEKRNIRWGELISGMLIVGSSIGLVISLWSTLKQAIPFFPALLFLLATSAIHGAGVYTLKRWRLKSTSQGLLIISALLVPLNFLAAISLSERDVEVTSPIYIFAVTVGVLGYGAITSSCGRLLMLRGWWLLPLGVLVPSVSQIVIARLGTPDASERMLWTLASVPFAAFLITVGSQLRMTGFWRRVTIRRSCELFLVMGTSAFALVMAMGLLSLKVEDVRWTMSTLAPAISLASIGVMGMGLVIHQRLGAVFPLSEDAPVAPLRDGKFAGLRLTGTTLIPLGAVGMLVSVGLAWPNPTTLMTVGFLSCVTLAYCGVSAKLPDLHYSAVAAFVLAGLLAFHRIGGTLATDAYSRDIINAFLLGRSSAAILVGALVVGLVALACRRNRIEDAKRLVISSFGLAALGELLAARAGFFGDGFLDVSLAGGILTATALAGLLGAVVMRRAELTWLASAGWLMAIVQLMHFNPQVEVWLQDAELTRASRISWTMFAHANSILLLAVGARLLRSRLDNTSQALGIRESLREGVLSPYLIGALVTAGIAASHHVAPALNALLTVDVFPRSLLTEAARHLAWFSVTWFVASVILVHRGLFAAGQVFATLTVMCLVRAASFEGQILDGQVVGGFFDARHLHAQLGVLAAWGWVWMAIRAAMRRRGLELANTKDSPFEFCLAGLVSVSCGLLIVTAATSVPWIFSGFADVPASSEPGVLIRASMILLGIVAVIGGPVQSAIQASAASRKFTLSMTGAAFVVVLIVAALIRSGGQFADIPQHTDWMFWVTVVLCAGQLAIQRYRSGRAPSPASEETDGATGETRLAVSERLGALDFGTFMIGLSLVFATGAAFAANATYAVTCWLCTVIALGYGAMTLRPASDSESPTDRPVSDFDWRTSIWAVATVFSLIPIAVLVQSRGAGLPVVDASHWYGRFEVMLISPLLILAAAFVTAARRHRVAMFLAGANAAIQLSVNAIVLSWLWAPETDLGGMHPLVVWTYANSIGLAISAWMWIGSQKLWQADAQREVARMSLRVIRVVASASVILPLLISLSTIYWRPGHQDAITLTAGSTLGIVAFLTVASSVWPYLRRLATGPVTIGVLLAGLSVQVSAVILRWDAPDLWHAYHSLMAGWFASAVVVLACGWKDALRQDAAGSKLWTATGAVLALLTAVSWLALGGLGADPLRPLPAQLAVFGGAGVMTALALRTRDGWIGFWSIVTWGLAAASLVIGAWTGSSDDLARSSGRVVGDILLSYGVLIGFFTSSSASHLHFAQLLVLGAALAAAFWQGVELWYQRRRLGLEEVGQQSSFLSPLRGCSPISDAVRILVAIIGAMIASSLVLQAYSGRWVEPDLDMSSPAMVGLLGLLSALVLLSFWDMHERLQLWLLYICGVLGAVLCVDQLGDRWEFNERSYHVTLGMTAAIYATVTSALFALRGSITALAERLRIPSDTETDAADSTTERTRRWLVAANSVFGLIAIMVGIWSVLNVDPIQWRMASAASILVVSVVPVLIVHRESRLQAQIGSLLLVALSAVAFGWAQMPVSDVDHYVLLRAIRLLEVTGIAALVYGMGIARLVPGDGQLSRSLRLASSFLGGLTLLVLVCSLAMEVRWPEALSDTQVGIVAAVLLGLSTTLISLALMPDKGPVSLSDKGRMAYVYTAEVIAALLFAHLRVTAPELFRPELMRYWPFIVMAIAFAGAGVGELFRRKGINVLSEPLHRTAAFMPLIPVLAFETSGLDGGYSTLLFIIGLMYIAMSMWRQSFVFALLAALAGNAGLWALFHESGLQLAERPQLWIIPPALSVLVASHWNRNRLTIGQLTSVRYACITLIYVSSSGEMFLHDIGSTIWLPMVLALLSIAGIFTGILLRVRAFLYVGSSFLLLALVSMVWHATIVIDQSWPWWAFGIVMGVLMLAVFGLFEKKRNEMLSMLNSLKQWDK